VIVAAHQPAYLPWLGYFDKLRHVDLFVFMDAVQFTKGNYQNRNKIKTPQGPLWLTVPVKSKGRLSSTICETPVDQQANWATKHLQAIHANYRRASNYQHLFPALQKLYAAQHDKLGELCWHHLLFWLRVMQIHTRLVKLSTLDVSGCKGELVLEICRSVGATCYFCGMGARVYMMHMEDTFAAAGIAITYQAFEHPVYRQQWGGFISHLGIVDYAMNALDPHQLRSALQAHHRSADELGLCADQGCTQPADGYPAGLRAT
jgi:hypothetical protein